MQTPSTLLSTPPNGRQLVIPDIHGCLKTFLALLKKVGFGKNDQLILLGDYINRGPSSAAVVDKIMEMLADGYQVFPLRGNHEQMALDSHQRRLTDKSLQKVPSPRKLKGLIDDEGLLLPTYAAFFNELPYFYETENAYLVHAGFAKENPFNDFRTMIWTRDAGSEKLNGKHIIRGHVSRKLEEIKQEVAAKAPVITLDAGCYRRSEEGKGYLCCLDLGNFQLVSQKNIEPIPSRMKTVKGDLIQLAKDGHFDVIVHGCNCFNTMGAGIAKAIKKEFPAAYQADIASPKGDKGKLGTFTSASIDIGGKTLIVVNAYTQYRYSASSRQLDYDALREAFHQVKLHFSGKHIAYPAIGAGLAGGDWAVISQIIEEELAGENHTFVEFQNAT